MRADDAARTMATGALVEEERRVGACRMLHERPSFCYLGGDVGSGGEGGAPGEGSWNVMFEFIAGCVQTGRMATWCTPADTRGHHPHLSQPSPRWANDQSHHMMHSLPCEALAGGGKLFRGLSVWLAVWQQLWVGIN